MRALVVGYGSIGARHSRLLAAMGVDVAVCSQWQGSIRDGFTTYPTLEQAWHAHRPDYVVIANRTCDHLPVVHQLLQLGYQGPMLIEKPLGLYVGSSSDEQKKTMAWCAYEGEATEEEVMTSTEWMYVGYNLRFHPLLRRLKHILNQEEAISVQVYAGQYLPQWRNRDYRNSYSAKQNEGGGVLHDLSHELDYVQWLFGRWQGVMARGGRYGALDIDSDDVYMLLLQTARCPLVNIQLNYLDRLRQRTLIVNTTRSTYTADLIAGTLRTPEGIEHWQLVPDETYVLQHKSILESGGAGWVCSWHEALDTETLIHHAVRSANMERWISHETIMHDMRKRRLEGGST